MFGWLVKNEVCIENQTIRSIRSMLDLRPTHQLRASRFRLFGVRDARKTPPLLK